MNIKNGLEEEYQSYVKVNSEDEYSKCVIDCGEIMGKALDEGKSPEEAHDFMCATEEGNELTGFMAGALMSAVVHFHPRGEEVRAWWNNRYGVTSEKGTVNPAIVTIETKE